MGQRAVQLSADLRVTHRECEVDVMVSVLELFFFCLLHTEVTSRIKSILYDSLTLQKNKKLKALHFVL